MPEQFKFPFKEEEDEQKIIGRNFGGKTPPQEVLKEYDKEMVKEEGMPTSEKESKEAAEKALSEIRRRNKEIEDKEKRED